MSRCTRHLVTLFFLVVLASPVYVAASDPIPEPVLSFARSITGDAGPTAVATTPVPGLYEVRVRGEFVYVTADGRFFLHGDLYESRGRRNLTESSRREDRLEVVDAIEPDTFIVFAPSKPKHTVTVFTDVDCPFCAKFHLEVPELNKLGVRVRYAAWPRTPPGTESYARSVSVWCADEPHQALTDAKAGREIEPATCDNPVQEHFEAGRKVGVRGTPTIVTEDGEVIGGYVPFRELAQMLEQG